MFFNHQISRFVGCTVTMGCLFFLSGCGGGTSAPEPTAGGTPSAPAATPQHAEPAKQQVAESSPPKVDPNKKETKWIGDIPYDVFYDQPLTIAADTTALQGTVPVASNSYPADGGSASNPEMTPAAAETPEPANTASSSQTDWAAVMPISLLNDQVKELRNRLNTNLQSVGSYNRAVDQIALDGSILCTMASIVTVHPEDVNWKDKAKFIRDLGYEIYSNAEGTGRTPFTACQEPFEKIKTMLDGGPEPDMEAEDVIDHSDLVYTSEMMKQIEITFNSLKANINTEDRMNEDLLGVERQMRLLAAFGTMMGTKSFENVDDPKYQKILGEFTNGGLNGALAVKQKNFVGFQDALNQIQTTCSECHQQFRGSDSGF